MFLNSLKQNGCPCFSSPQWDKVSDKVKNELNFKKLEDGEFWWVPLRSNQDKKWFSYTMTSLKWRIVLYCMPHYIWRPCIYFLYFSNCFFLILFFRVVTPRIAIHFDIILISFLTLSRSRSGQHNNYVLVIVSFKFHQQVKLAYRYTQSENYLQQLYSNCIILLIPKWRNSLIDLATPVAHNWPAYIIYDLELIVTWHAIASS